MNKITTNTDPEAAVRYLESQPVRYGATRRPYIPLGCDQQGRLTPTLLDDARLAPAEELQADPPRRISEQDRGERIGSVIGWSVVGMLCLMALVHVAHVYGIGPGVARVAGWVASFFH